MKQIFLILIGISFQMHAQVNNNKEQYKDVKIFAERFVSKFVNVQYILSENKLVEPIEKEFFDDDTTVSPPGDQDTGIKINVIKSFRIDSISDKGSYYAVDIFFLLRANVRLLTIKLNALTMIRKRM